MNSEEIKKILENEPSMKFIELVKIIWPNITDEEADVLLWETTAFPFASVEIIVKQLEENHRSSNGSVDKAIEDSYQRLHEEAARLKTWIAISE